MKSMHKPKVCLVGAGPGDDGLITVRGRAMIKDADCIIYDYLVNPDLLNERREDCKLIYVGKKAGSHTMPQDGINRLLAKMARMHRKVVRLKGGDPFIFGRGAEEACYLKSKGIDFEIVPGVTSAIAVPAYAGIPLTERTRTSTVGFITGHEDPTKSDSGIDWAALAKALGTMVFLMGIGNLDSITKKLIACGKPKNTPVAIIQWGTTARQRTVTGTLRDIAQASRKNNIKAPAIIVVGETVTLRKDLGWFERKPLFSKRVIVTRTRDQASALSNMLKDLGSEVTEIPTIRIVSLKADRLAGEALSSENYDWVFFTSQNGVDEFAKILERSGKDCRVLGSSRVCAIGPSTANALRAIGIRPDYIPPQFIAESIVKHFKNARRKGAPAPKALILRARGARDSLPDGLKKAGFKVRVVDLYDTVLSKEGAPILKRALGNGVDFITFTSSSTVRNFIKLAGSRYKRKLSGVKLVSIGPVTSSTIKGLGLKVYAEAKRYTIEGLVDAMTRIKRHD